MLGSSHVHRVTDKKLLVLVDPGLQAESNCVGQVHPPKPQPLKT